MKIDKRILALIVFFILLVLSTSFYGATDSKEYSDTSKFFAGEYPAKIRASHSYLYGLIHSPFVGLFDSFLIFKITTLISLLLIVYSVYWMSGKNKGALWLMLLSPIIWYMGPWTSPLPLASLFFLWGYYFIRKYDEGYGLKNLFYSGVFLGLSLAFWASIMYFVFILGFVFLYNKKLLHFLYFGCFILVGLLPQFILDHILFGFAFLGLLRNLLGNFAFSILGGIYGQGTDFGILNITIILFFVPIFIFALAKREIFSKERKTFVFLLFSSILILLNPQIRILLVFIPIITLKLSKYLNYKQYKKQLYVFLIITLVVIVPYIIQIKYETNGNEFSSFVRAIPDLKLSSESTKSLIIQDLDQIEKEYPNEIFVVGPSSDDYRVLANVYWGGDVKEFVSIEDYKLNLSAESESVIAQKEFCTNVKIKERRDFCFSVLIRKAFNDDTDYSSIKYGISEENEFGLEGFELVKKYEKLNLFEKVS